MMKHKLAVLCSILLALALSAHASWFSDYPPKALDIVAQPIDHYFVKDELAFALSSAVWLKDVVLVCELRYKDKTRTITKTQATWSAVGAIKIELPDNLTDLKTVHLTGTFKTLEICKDGKFQLIDGYKIDSEFDMTHTTSSQ